MTITPNFWLRKITNRESASLGLSQSTDDQSYVGSAIRVDKRGTVTIGTVATVYSGNSLTFTNLDGDTSAVRLAGVALRTGDSTDSKAFLETYAEGKHCWIEWQRRDPLDYPLVMLYLNGVNVNLLLVSEGLAQYDRSSHDDLRFINAEFLAKHSRKGIWAEKGRKDI